MGFLNFFVRSSCCDPVCFEDWDNMEMLNCLTVLMGGLYWGFFRNDRFKGIDGFQGIDGLIHWFKSLLLNFVICTFGIFCLDMILIEIIQMENPRHVIDAMSSMQLGLIIWWYCVVQCGFFYVCRKGVTKLIMKLFVVNLDSTNVDCRKAIMLSHIWRMKDKREYNKGGIQGLKVDRSCWNEFLMLLQWILGYIFCIFWYFNFVCRMFGFDLLWGYLLCFHFWTVGFFKGLTPCFGLNGDWWCGYCKGVKLPFFPLLISPWYKHINIKVFWDFWSLVDMFKKWMGSWLWIGWFG